MFMSSDTSDQHFIKNVFIVESEFLMISNNLGIKDSLKFSHLVP